jgi:hypothetical protein
MWSNNYRTHYMDTFSVEENTTVVGGHSTDPNEDPFSKLTYPGTSANRKHKGKSALNDFVRATDYMTEERPFFVNIDKNGLIAALQKLDKQLQNVCHIVPSLSHTLTSPLVREGQQDSIQKGLCNESPGLFVFSHTSQSPTDWIGKEVNPGRVGLVNHGGLPKILTKAGRYPGFPLRNWWARKWVGTKGRAFIHNLPCVFV